jgi:hexosaminidase
MLPPSFGSGPDADTSPGSGSYSREEFVDLIRFAAGRHVEVIPEVDLPGHARAAIVSMENRYRRLMAEGDSAAANEHRLVDPLDRSRYVSIQGWDDNVVNVCLESTYRFVETIVDELVALYAEAGETLSTIHVGGDEVPPGVWEKSAACNSLTSKTSGAERAHDLSAHFFGRVADILAARGLDIAGWDEIAEVLPPKAGSDGNLVIPYVWNTVWGWGGEEKPYTLANAGYHVVLSNAPSLYFDLAYEKHPEEPGYAWAGFVGDRETFEFTPFDIYSGAEVDRMGQAIPANRYDGAIRLTEDGRRRVLGIQGQLWGERTPTKALYEYQLYPKMLALAERAWSPAPEWGDLEAASARGAAMEEAWTRFANTLGQREFVRMRRAAEPIDFRIPPPGAELRDGVLHANATYPGLDIRYTTDGTRPDAESQLYDSPVRVDGPISVRAFDATGRGSRTESVE